MTTNELSKDDFEKWHEGATALADALGKFGTIPPAGSSNSQVHVNAGGITNAVAVCGFVVCLVLFVLFAIWMMWQQSELKSQQEAWIQVWQQHVAEHKPKGE